jgi:hypothetical protein
MLRATNFLDAIRQHCGDLHEEVRGLAQGCGQPFDLILAAQLMDEEWAFRSRVSHNQKVAEKCSSIAVATDSGITWIGQNMDLGCHTDGHQLVLRIAPAGCERGALVFTVGGMMGLLGVNACGVGICVNALPQLPTRPEGIPIAFMVRKLLQSRTAVEAVERLLSLPHATGQHYLIADPHCIKSFEASPEAVVEYLSPNPHRVLHTNHALAHPVALSPFLETTNTGIRLEALKRRLLGGEPDLATIMSALSSSDDALNPICRTYDRDTKATGDINPYSSHINFTTGSMVSALRVGRSAIHSWICAGPPNKNEYIHLEIDDTGVC